MKHSYQTLATCLFNTCNTCNIPTYFCNNYMNHLQHNSKTSQTLETSIYNIGGEASVGQFRLLGWELATHELQEHRLSFVGALGLARDDLRCPSTCAQPPQQGWLRRWRGIPMALGWGRGWGGTAWTKGEGDVVGLGGMRRQRWRHGALLLLTDARRDERWGGRNGLGRSFSWERRARRSGEPCPNGCGQTSTRVEVFPLKGVFGLGS
jgi:hypothetical protein